MCIVMPIDVYFNNSVIYRLVCIGRNCQITSSLTVKNRYICCLRTIPICASYCSCCQITCHTRRDTLLRITIPNTTII